MMHNHEADFPALVFPITIIGVGGLGSQVALSLARMGCLSITVIDPSKVDENTSFQLYDKKDIGLSKVDALQKVIRTFTRVIVMPFSGNVQEYVDLGLFFGQIVINTVNNQTERKKIWGIIKPLFGGVNLYIDVQVEENKLRIFCICPFDADSVIKYQKQMDLVPPQIGTRNIDASMVGKHIASIINNYVKKQNVLYENIIDLK